MDTKHQIPGQYGLTSCVNIIVIYIYIMLNQIKNSLKALLHSYVFWEGYRSYLSSATCCIVVSVYSRGVQITAHGPNMAYGLPLKTHLLWPATWYSTKQAAFAASLAALIVAKMEQGHDSENIVSICFGPQPRRFTSFLLLHTAHYRCAVRTLGNRTAVYDCTEKLRRQQSQTCQCHWRKRNVVCTVYQWVKSRITVLC